MATEPRVLAPQVSHAISGSVQRLEMELAIAEHTAAKLEVANRKLEGDLEHYRGLHLSDQNTIADLKTQLKASAKRT